MKTRIKKSKMNKKNLPIKFSVCRDLELLIISGINLQGTLDKKKLVLKTIEICKEIFNDDVEVSLNIDFDIFFMVAENLILKIEVDSSGLYFVPVLNSEEIELWINRWTHDIRLIYFMGTVLQALEDIGYKSNGEKKQTN